MRSKLATGSVLILATALFGCSSNPEKQSLAGLDVACTVQLEGGGSPHQRFRTEGYLTAGSGGSVTLSSNLTSNPAAKSFRIPHEMFESQKSEKDFRVKTVGGGTASYNDRVEITFDSFNDPKTHQCTYTIEEIRKL